MPLDTRPPFSCNGFCIISLPMSASISEMPLVWLVWWVCPDVLCTLFNELTPAPIIRDGSTLVLKTSSEVSILTVVYLAAWICVNPSSPIPSAKEKRLPKPRNDWFSFFSEALFWPIKDISMQVSTQPHFAFCTRVCVCLYMNCSNKQNTHFLLPISQCNNVCIPDSKTNHTLHATKEVSKPLHCNCDSKQAIWCIISSSGTRKIWTLTLRYFMHFFFAHCC